MSDGTLHPAALGATGLLAECRISFTRRSGPGGQHRNKVETAVVLVHLSTGLRAEANERRSQAANRQMALVRLRLKLALEVRRPREPGQSPSDLWRSRCRDGRVVVSTSHADFPALLAEALDVLAAQGMEVKLAAATLDCSPSQLVKFIKREPLALAMLNRRRRDNGLRPLE